MSLTKHEILKPVRHFNMHDDPLTYIESLHLVLWDKGLCIAGYGQEGNVLTTKVYSYPAWDIAAIESVFINEPLVAGPQPVTHIWIADERTMVVPEHLYEQEAAAAWLRRFYFVEATEHIHASTIPQGLQATVVYPVQEKLISLIQKYFAEGKVDALSRMILCQEQSAVETAAAEIIFLDQKTVLTLHRRGNLLLHQITDTTDINNLVYKLAVICQQYELSQEELQVSICGLCTDEAAEETLRSFFPRISIPGSEQFSTFTLLSRLIACVS